MEDELDKAFSKFLKRKTNKEILIDIEEEKSEQQESVDKLSKLLNKMD